MSKRKETLTTIAKPLLLAILLTIITLILVHGENIHGFSPEDLVDMFAGQRHGWMVVVYCLFFIAGGSLGIPPAIFVVAAGLLWPFPMAVGISLVCGITAAYSGFLLSRYIARDFCSRHIPKKLWDYNERLEENGLKTVLLLRLLFFLFPPVNWLLGLSPIRSVDYLLGTLLGAFPLMVFYILLGHGWLSWLLRS